MILRPTDALGVAVATDATAPVRFAQQELCSYLSTILESPVAAADGATIRLELGNPDQLGEEGYRIVSAKNTLTITGGSPRAVLYAVYAFLRDNCGCRFSAPGTDSEHVPQRDAIVVPEGVVERRPRLWYRGLQFSYVDAPGPYRRAIDWMPKIGLNYVMTMMAHPSSGTVQRTTIDPQTGEPLLEDGRRNPRMNEAWFDEYLRDDIEKRGLLLDMNHHNLLYWLPPEIYLETNPEFYAEVDGVRGKSFAQLCICTSNQAAVQTLIDNVAAWARANPTVGIVGVIPEDGQGMCQCAQCVATDPDSNDVSRRMGETRGAEYELRSLGSRYARLLNQVARTLRPEFPELLIGGAAYVDLQWPPRDVELESNIVTWVALYWRDGARPLHDTTTPYNAFYLDLLKQWKASFRGRLTVYDYTMGMNAQRSLPYPQSHLMLAEWPALEQMGIEGATMQCLSSCMNAYALNILAFARYAWEGNIDHETLLDEYLLGVFGGAAAAMQPLFDALFAAMAELAACDPNDPNSGPAGIPGGVLQPTADNIRFFVDRIGKTTLHQLLEAARDAAVEEREQRQVAVFSDYVTYWLLAVDGDAAAVKQHLATMRESGWISVSTPLRWK